MNINYVEIRSSITPVNQNVVGHFFKDIEKAGGFKLHEVNKDEWKKSDLSFIYIATGGTEGLFLSEYEKHINNTCYILTSGESNSLAASMEILSYLRTKGKKGEILHGDAEEIAKRINIIVKAHKAFKKIEGMRLGVFGKPSDWLIASDYDPLTLKRKYNITIVEVSMKEILSEINLGIYEDNMYTRQLKERSFDREELEKALGVYGAFKRLVEVNNLDGFTVRCFDLLDTVFTTGCLALAILNAEGIYAGCEGDVPSLLSMAVLNAVSEQPVFQANPSRINTKDKEMVFAHCTLPLNMPKQIKLTTHYESGIGVGISGEIGHGPITVFKTSGDLSEYYVKEGEIIENLHESNLCRTQIKIKLDDFDYFLKYPIANHHLIANGKYQEIIEELYTHHL